MATQTLEKASRKDISPAEHTRSGRQYRPNVDIVETAEELTVFVDMPGVTADNVDVNFENGALTIHGTVRQRQEDLRYRVREYGVGDFHRVFAVSKAVDGTKIAAELSDGVLTLHLPKADAVKPRKIAVTAS